MASSCPLRCPLCFEPFDQPLLLRSCMHSFCKKCLCKYVETSSLDLENKEANFDCPVCGTNFHGPASSSHLSDWLEQLPSDGILLDLIAKRSNTGQHCEPCYRRDPKSKSPASKFCKECCERFCDQCSAVHQSFKGSRFHTVTDIDSQRANGLDFGITCEHHGDKMFEYYCSDHKELICSKCAISDHRSCTILGLEDASNLLKSQIPINSLLLNSETLKQNVTRRVQSLDTDISNLQENILTAIENKREKINASFDKYKETVVQHINKYTKQHSDRISETRQKGDTLLTGLTNSQNVLNILRNHGNVLQTYIRCQSIGRQLKGIETCLEEHKSRSPPLASFENRFSLSVTALAEGIEDIGKFSISILKPDEQAKPQMLESNTEILVKGNRKCDSGSVQHQRGSVQNSVQHQSRSVRHRSTSARHRSSSVRHQSGSVQVQGELLEVVNQGGTFPATNKSEGKASQVSGTGTNVKTPITTNVRVNTVEIHRIKPPIGSSPVFRGAVFLPDDRVVLTDIEHNRLILLDSNIKYMSELNLENQPRKVAAVSIDEVVVTSRRNILCVKINETMKISRVIRVSYNTASISFDSTCNRLFYSTCEKGEWRLLSVDYKSGEEILLKENQEFRDGTHFTVFVKGNKDHLLNSSWHDEKLYCQTFDDKNVFIAELLTPCGVDVDKYGNIFVASSFKHNIFHVTPDGQSIKILKGLERVRLHKPYEVRLNYSQTKILVTQYDNSDVAVLGMSYT